MRCCMGSLLPESSSNCNRCQQVGNTSCCRSTWTSNTGVYSLGRTDKEETWKINDLRKGEVIQGEPAPEHLLYAAENLGEATVMTAKLCIRPNDTSKGRQLKLNHYIDLHKKYFGTIPDDIYKFVRVEKDIPITYKRDVMKMLEEKGLETKEIPQEPSLMDI